MVYTVISLFFLSLFPAVLPGVSPNLAHYLNTLCIIFIVFFSPLNYILSGLVANFPYISRPKSNSASKYLFVDLLYLAYCRCQICWFTISSARGERHINHTYLIHILVCLFIMVVAQFLVCSITVDWK